VNAWLMPDWMEPYRELINNTGGNPIEELLNDRHTTAQVNLIRAALIVAVTSQVHLLTTLHNQGMLTTGKPKPRQQRGAGFWRGIEVGRNVEYASEQVRRGNVISDEQVKLLREYDPDALADTPYDK
jgi:hypothetical protein